MASASFELLAKKQKAVLLKLMSIIDSSVHSLLASSKCLSRGGRKARLFITAACITGSGFHVETPSATQYVTTNQIPQEKDQYLSICLAFMSEIRHFCFHLFSSYFFFGRVYDSCFRMFPLQWLCVDTSCGKDNQCIC